MDAFQLTRGLPSIPISAAARRCSPTSTQVSAVGPRSASQVNAAVDFDSRKGNWVMNILGVGSIWEKQRESFEDAEDNLGEDIDNKCGKCEECTAKFEEEEEREKMVFDRESFSRLLKRVSMVEIDIYRKLCYLGSLAYRIDKIKRVSLLKYHGLHFVTSSLEKKAELSKSEKEYSFNANKKPDEQLPDGDINSEESSLKKENEKHVGNIIRVSPAVAYRIAASAASFLQSQTKSILPFGSEKNEESENCKSNEREEDITCSEMASFVATTNSVTAVVAGKEKMKQAVAKDLNSAHSSPCEWFICDDDKSNTRYFVIQGSESLASWQANLLFEPIKFEGLDVPVHRGIYEAAKGIYQQMLPEIKAHLKAKGRYATLRFTGHRPGPGHRQARRSPRAPDYWGPHIFHLNYIYNKLSKLSNKGRWLGGKVFALCFQQPGASNHPGPALTGHSLGGSLSLLVNLMLLIRGDAPMSALLPVIMFGSPNIMCGGDHLLCKLGMPQSHVQAIMLHRDIVPRAFSCNYPDHVAKILKALNGNFRNHPCLLNQKLLYAPMGKLLILQPEEKQSPHHLLLPSGSGLYLLGHPLENPDSSTNLLLDAIFTFFNSPHPLEILSKRSSYGADGTIYRDHDMTSYLRSIHGVWRDERRLINKARKESRRNFWWPIASGYGSDGIVGQRARLTNLDYNRRFSFVGVVNGGRETLKRIQSFVASLNVSTFLVLWIPARILLAGTLSIFPR